MTGGAMPTTSRPSDQTTTQGANPALRIQSAAPDDLRLGLHTRSSQWVLRVGDQIWMMRGSHMPCVLAGHLPISFLDGPEHRLRDDAMGDAQITTGGALQLISRDPQHAPVTVPLPTPAPPSGFASWAEGMHPDGWIELSARLSLEGVRRLGLRCYLPPIDGQNSKTMNLRLDDAHMPSADIARDKLTEVWCDLPASYGELHIDLAYIEPMLGQQDQRLLGCVIAEINLDGGSWQSAQGFL